jgi:hypothetical protein
VCGATTTSSSSSASRRKELITECEFQPNNTHNTLTSINKQTATTRNNNNTLPTPARSKEIDENRVRRDDYNGASKRCGVKSARVSFAVCVCVM